MSSVVKSKEKDAKKSDKEKDSKKNDKDKSKNSKDKDDTKKASIGSISSSQSSTSKSGLKIKDKLVEVVMNKTLDHHDGYKGEKATKGHSHSSSVHSAFILSATEPSIAGTSTAVKDKEVKSSPFNAFLNAPAPAFLSSKKHKDKDAQEGTRSKVKLKLKRSKNSVEDAP